MSSNAISGMGTKFYRWTADSSAWTEVAEINSISGPTKSRDTIEVTTLSTTGGYKEFISDLRDAGNVSLSMNFTRATYDIMNADYENDENQNYKIVLPDTEETTLEFEGMVMELPLNITVGDRITADVEIKISGKPTVYDGSSG